MPENIYCFVDESGQDTEGRLFIVGMVSISGETDSTREACELIEAASGKGKAKWTKARYECRREYVDRVLQSNHFRGLLSFAVFEGSRNYRGCMVKAIGRALANAPGKSIVLVDALPRGLQVGIGLDLRREGVKLEKVRGIRKDENNALVRLADALCGLVRSARDGEPDFQEMLDWGLRARVLRDLS